MPLLEEAQRGDFDPLSDITHRTISGVNLSGPDFLSGKDKIVAALERQISSGDMDRMAALRRNRKTL